MKNSLHIHKNKKILLLDFAAEKNRGDAVMQMAMVKLTKKYFPDSKLTVSTVFGYNQFPECLSQFDHTDSIEGLGFVGGLLQTNETFVQSEQRDKRSKYKKIVKLLAGVWFLCVVVLRLPVRFSHFFRSSQFEDAWNVFTSTDLVIWNGRNFRSHSFYKEPYDIFVLLFNPLVCVFLKKPIACIGASVWEIQNPISRILLRFVFRRTFFISVREEKSLKNIQKIIPIKKNTTPLVMHLPDLSFVMLNQYRNEIKDEVIDDVQNARMRIGLTVVGRREIGSGELFRTYTTAVNRLMMHIVEKCDAHIYVIPQVTYGPEANGEAIEAVFAGVAPSAYTVKQEDMSVSQLLKEYNTLDFLVATRMHSAIFALSVGTPVMAISYDSGAKWNILLEMGLPVEALLSAIDLKEIDLISRFTQLKQNSKDIMREVDARLQDTLIPEAEDHFQLLCSEYEKEKNK